MKIKKLLIPLLLICIALFAMVGCSNTNLLITDLDGYTDMQSGGCSNTNLFIIDLDGYTDMQSGGDKIEINFENGTQYGFKFTIEDKTEIDEIVNSVLTTRLTNLGKNSPVAPGDNTSFTVYQGENIYLIALSGVWANDNRYAFSTNDLRDKINAIAEERGAFDDRTDYVLYDNAKEWIREDFQNENLIKCVGFIDDDSENELPDTRTFLITDNDNFEKTFIDDFTGFEIDFNKELIIVYTFAAEYVSHAAITDLSLNNNVLTIDYRIPLIPETGSAVRPFQRWFVVKIDKLDITSVIVNEN